MRACTGGIHCGTCVSPCRCYRTQVCCQLHHISQCTHTRLFCSPSRTPYPGNRTRCHTCPPLLSPPRPLPRVTRTKRRIRAPTLVRTESMSTRSCCTHPDEVAVSPM